MQYPQLFSTHKKKIIIGAPILFLLLINAGVSLSGNTYRLVPEGTVFTTVADAVPIRLEVTTKSAVNAMGGTVTFAPQVLQADAVTRVGSIIDLWSEDPVIGNTAGEIHWSGGVINETASSVAGTVFTIQFHAAAVGKTRVQVTDGQILAKDGEGTNILSGTESVVVYVRLPGQPSPDINKDGVLSISDINSLYLHTFGDYAEMYDLNQDQDLNWSDVMTLINLSRSESSDRK